jgi:hypothetical protein
VRTFAVMGTKFPKSEPGWTVLQQYATPFACWQLEAKAFVAPPPPRVATSTDGAARAKAAKLRMVVIAVNFILDG